MADAGDSVSDCLEALQTCPLLNLEQSPQLLRNSMLHKSYKETMALWKSIKDGTYQAQRTAVEPLGVPASAAAAAAAGAPTLQGPSAAMAAAYLQEEPPPAESPAMSAAMDRPRVRGRYRSRQRQRWACQEDKENAAAADAASAAAAAHGKAAAAAPVPAGGAAAGRGQAAGGNATPFTGAGGSTAAAAAASSAAGGAGTPLTGFPANPSLGESWIRTTPLSGPLPEASATSTPSAAISAVTAAPAVSAGVSSGGVLPRPAASQQQQRDGAEATTPMSAGPLAAVAAEQALQQQVQPEAPGGQSGLVLGGGSPLPCAGTPGTPAAGGGGVGGASPAPGDLPGDLLAQLSLVASGDMPGGMAELLRGASSSGSFPEGSVSGSLAQLSAGAAGAEGAAAILAGRVPVGCSWFGDVGKWAWCGKEAATPIPASLAHTPQEMRERHLQSPDRSEHQDSQGSPAQQESQEDAEQQQQQQLGEEDPHPLAEECATPPPAQAGQEVQQHMAQESPAWQQQQQQQLADEAEADQADGEEVAMSAAGGFKGFWGGPHAPSSERYSSSSAMDTPGGVSQGSGSPHWNTPMLHGAGPAGADNLGPDSRRAAADGASSSCKQGGASDGIRVTAGAASKQDPATAEAAGADLMTPGSAQALQGQPEGPVGQLHALLDPAASFDAVSSSCSSSGDDWAAAERLQQQLKVSLVAAGMDDGAEGSAEGHQVAPAGDVGDSLGSPGVLMSSPVPQNSSWAGKWGAYSGGRTPELTPQTAGAAEHAVRSSSSAARGMVQAGGAVQSASGGSDSIGAGEGSGSGGRGGVEQQLQFSSSASSGGRSPVRKLNYQLHLSEEQEATPPPQTPAAAAAGVGVAAGSTTTPEGRLPDPATSDCFRASAAACTTQEQAAPASPPAGLGSTPMAQLAGSTEGWTAYVSTRRGPAGPLQGLLLDALDLEESLAVGPSLAGLLAAPAAGSPAALASPEGRGDTPLADPAAGQGDAAAKVGSPAAAAVEGTASSPHPAVGSGVTGGTPLRLLLEQSLEFATPVPAQAAPAPGTPEAAAAANLGSPGAAAGGDTWQHMLGYTPGPAEAATPAGTTLSAAAAATAGSNAPTWGKRATPAGGATPADVSPTAMPAVGAQLASSSPGVGNLLMTQGFPADAAAVEAAQGEGLGAPEGAHGRVSPSSSSISEGHVKRLVQSGPWAPPVAAASNSDDCGAVPGMQEEDGQQAQQQQQQPVVVLEEEGLSPPPLSPRQQQQDVKESSHQEEWEGSPLSFGRPMYSSERLAAATAPPTPLPFGTLANVQPTSSSPGAASEQGPQQAAAAEEGEQGREGGCLLPAVMFGGIRIGKGATEQQLRDLLEQQQRRREQLLTSLLSSSISLSPGRALKSLTPRLLIRHQQHLAARPPSAAAAAAEVGGEQTPLALRSRQGAARGGAWQGGSTPGKSPGPSPCWSELSFQQGLAGRVYTPAAAGGGARGRGFLQRSLSLGDLSPYQASTNPAAARTPEKGEAHGRRFDTARSMQGSPGAAGGSAADEAAPLPMSHVSPVAAALLGSGQLVRAISASSATASRQVSRGIAALDLSSSLELASNPLALAGLAEQLAAADADVMELQLMAAQAVRDATASRAERDVYAAACKDMQQQLRLLQEQLNCSEAEGQRCLLAMADLVDLAAEMPDASPGGPGGDQLDQSLPYLDVAALVQAAAASTPTPGAASSGIKGEAADSPSNKPPMAAGTAASAAEQLELLVEQVEAQQQALAKQNRHLQGLLAQQEAAAAAAATPGAAPLTPQLPGTPVTGLLMQQGEPPQVQATLLAQVLQEQQHMQQQMAETQQQLRALMQQRVRDEVSNPPCVSVAAAATQTHPEHPQQPSMVAVEQVQGVEAELQHDELQEQLQASQQLVRDLEQQVESLQKQLEAAQQVAVQTKQQLQAQLAAAEEQEEQQAEALQQAVQEVQRAQAERQEAEAAAASLQQQLQQAQAQVEDLQLQLFKAEELATQDQQPPSSGSGGQELDVLELRADKADLESELAAAQQQLEEANDTRHQPQQQLVEAEAAKEQLAQRLQEQQGQLVRYQQELQELRAAHDDTRDQLTAQATEHLAAVRKQQDAAAALAAALAEKQQLQEALLAQQAQTDSLSKMCQLLSGQQQHKRGSKPAAGVAATDSPHSASSGLVEGVEDEGLGAHHPSSAAAAGQTAAAMGVAMTEETPRSRRLAASKGQLERRCHELLQENEQLRRGLSSSQQQLQEADASHQQEVGALQEELQDLQALCNQQAEQLAEAQQRIDHLQQGHDQQAQQLVTAEQQLQQAVDEVQQAAAARLQQLQEAAQNQEAALEHSQQQLSELQAACDLHKAQLAEAGDQLQQARQECQEQQGRAAAAEAQLDELRAVSEQQAQQLEDMQAQVQRQQAELAQQSAVLADTEGLLQQVEEELQQERAQAAAAADEQEQSLKEEHRQVLQQLQQDRQQQEEQLAQAKERLVQMVALHQQMQCQLQSTQQQLEEAQAEAEEREQQLAETQQQAADWEEHVSAQKGLLEEAQQQLQLLLEQNQQLAQAMQEQHQRDMQDASAEDSQRVALLRQQQQRYQELQQQHERTQQQLLEQQEEHAALAADHAQAQQQLQKKQQQVVELKAALQRLVQQQEELQEAAEQAGHQHNMARLEVAALTQQLEAQHVEAEQALAVHQADASQQLLAQQQAAAKQLAHQKAEAAQQLSACQQRLALCQELLQALQQQQLLREKQQEQRSSQQEEQEERGQAGSREGRPGLEGATAAADMQVLQQQLQQVTAEKQELAQELHQAKAVVEYLESCIRQLGRHNAELVAQLGPTPPAAAADMQAPGLPLPLQQPQQHQGTATHAADPDGQEAGSKAALSPALLARVLAAATRVHEKNKVLKQRLRQSGQP